MSAGTKTTITVEVDGIATLRKDHALNVDQPMVTITGKVTSVTMVSRDEPQAPPRGSYCVTCKSRTPCEHFPDPFWSYAERMTT